MPKRLIIDTNLLLLLVIGAVEQGRHIQNSKRLGDFDYADYQAIWTFIKGYNDIFITPYIATEVSNLIDLSGHARELAYQVARELFALFKKIDVNIDADCAPLAFEKFGITDSSLIRLAPDYCILTSDEKLYYLLCVANYKIIVPYRFLRKASRYGR